MKFRASFHRGARIDVDEALVYYQTEASFHVANEFLDTIDEAIESIIRNPKVFLSARNGTRKKQLHKFPFNVIYAVRGDEIRIMAVAHHSREPNYWIGRE